MGIEESLSAEQKLAKVMVALRVILPYYSTFYEAIPKSEYEPIGTIGVSTKDLVYNKNFIEETPVDELIFIILHEIAHVALIHPARLEGKDHQLWNIACDYYVNKLVANEVLTNVREQSKDSGLVFNPGMSLRLKGISITFPKDLVYTSKIDLVNDTADSIYKTLYEQAEHNGYFSSPGGEQGFGDSDTDSSGVGSGSNMDAGLSDGNNSMGYGFSVKDDNFVLNNNKEYAKSDLRTNGNYTQEIQDAKKLLSDVQVRVEMSGQDCGDSPAGLRFKVDQILKSKVDWRKLLSKYCRALKNNRLSFSRPDKRMYYQDAIYPGKHSEVSDSIKGMKICIDSSGSVSDKDIMYFMGQVKDILDKFDVDAELIWWDTEAYVAGNLSEVKDLERVNMYGRGGTNPSCLFEYFDSKECVNKPYVTLVLTDMYWDSGVLNNGKWKKKYKDTIWIGTKHMNNGFKPPFGKLAEVKQFYE